MISKKVEKIDDIFIKELFKKYANKYYIQLSKDDRQKVVDEIIKTVVDKPEEEELLAMIEHVKKKMKGAVGQKVLTNRVRGLWFNYGPRFLGDK